MNLEPDHSDAIRTLVLPDILLNRIRSAVRTLTVSTYADLPGIDTRARRITREPLLTQLRDAIRPDIGRTMSGAGSGRPIPLNEGAYELHTSIEEDISSAYEAATDLPPTGTTEQMLADWYEAFATAHATGETNIAQLENYAARITGWVTAIEDMFDPPRIREYPICPVCGYTHTIRDDAAGDPIQVRCLTLRYHPTGRAIATCRHCHSRWEGTITPDGTTGEITELHTAIQDNIDQHGPITLARIAPTYLEL